MSNRFGHNEINYQGHEEEQQEYTGEEDQEEENSRNELDRGAPDDEEQLMG